MQSVVPNLDLANPTHAASAQYFAIRDSAETARTLGLALLRSGDGPGAVDALLRARTLYRHRDRLTDLLLALAYERAGKPNSARREYNEAIKLLDQTREHGEDLDRIRAEADRRFGKRGV